MIDLIIRPAQPKEVEEAMHWQDGDNFRLFLEQSIPVDLGGRGHKEEWVAMSDEEVVAYALLDIDSNHQARLAFIVKPSRRREGIAKQFIPELLKVLPLGTFSRIIGTPNMGDTAGKKVLINAGFREIGYDENGQLLFERR